MSANVRNLQLLEQCEKRWTQCRKHEVIVETNAYLCRYMLILICPCPLRTYLSLVLGVTTYSWIIQTLYLSRYRKMFVQCLLVVRNINPYGYTKHPILIRIWIPMESIEIFEHPDGRKFLKVKNCRQQSSSLVSSLAHFSHSVQLWCCRVLLMSPLLLPHMSVHSMWCYHI